MKPQYRKLLTQKEADALFNAREQQEETPITGHFLCKECGATGVFQEKLLQKCKCRTAIIEFIKEV